jgi:hypothetical protein
MCVIPDAAGDPGSLSELKRHFLHPIPGSATRPRDDASVNADA